MSKVVIENYSRFADSVTGANFLPEMDLQSHCSVGVADVDEEAHLAHFAERSSFSVLSDEEYSARFVAPKIELPEATPSATGDPLIDAANTQQTNNPLNGPPAPPKSK